MSAPAQPWWEKRGNTAWACCPSCRAWLPVSTGLLAAKLDLHCPSCHAEFAAAAATVERPA